jgi:hypothetical protein
LLAWLGVTGLLRVIGLLLGVAGLLGVPRLLRVTGLLGVPRLLRVTGLLSVVGLLVAVVRLRLGSRLPLTCLLCRRVAVIRACANA